MGSAPSELSMVSATSARPRGARLVVPAKMTSSILPPRRLFAPCSPITQESASTTLDLPDPLGPTTQVIPGSSRRVVEEAKDLKPRTVRDFRYTCPSSPGTASRRGRRTTAPPPEHYRPPRPTAGNGAGHENPGNNRWPTNDRQRKTGTPGPTDYSPPMCFLPHPGGREKAMCKIARANTHSVVNEGHISVKSGSANDWP